MWRITKDLINRKRQDDSDLRRSPDWKAHAKKTTHAFQLRDAGDEVYFEGVSTDCVSDDAFEPLEGLGHEYGCTSIWYKNADGVWEMLEPNRHRQPRQRSAQFDLVRAIMSLL